LDIKLVTSPSFRLESPTPSRDRKLDTVSRTT